MATIAAGEVDAVGGWIHEVEAPTAIHVLLEHDDLVHPAVVHAHTRELGGLVAQALLHCGVRDPVLSGRCHVAAFLGAARQ